MHAGNRKRRYAAGGALLFVIGFLSTGTSTFFSAGGTSTIAPACGTTPASTPMGVYTGAASPSGLSDFAATTGARVTLASDFLPGNAGFPGMSDPQELSWMMGPWQGSGCQLVLGVPMIPTESNGKASGTLAGGATGAYNSYFKTLAQTLVNAGFGNAVLRLGWEFDGKWFTWAVANNTDASNFASYWQQIVTSMRSVSGANFKFDWNPSGGYVSWNINDAYPGDAYVDYVGLDRYDQTWSTPLTPQSAWNDLTTMPDGMNWLASFGSAHNKPITLPEWGVSLRSDGHGLGDDPYFVNQMQAWIAAHNVAFTSYFNSDPWSDESHAITDGKFANALGTFKSVFAPPPSPPPNGSTPTATTSTISLSSGAPAYGQSVTVTVNVAPSASGGSVQLGVDGANVGSPGALSGSTHNVAFSLTGLTIGGHTISSSYSGSTTDGPSVASAHVQVAAAPTSLVASNTRVVLSLTSRSVTMTGTLTSTVTSGAISGRTVTFTANSGGGTCSATTNGSGVASCTVQLGLVNLNPSSYSATFGGDTDYLSSSGSAAVS